MIFADNGGKVFRLRLPGEEPHTLAGKDPAMITGFCKILYPASIREII